MRSYRFGLKPAWRAAFLGDKTNQGWTGMALGSFLSGNTVHDCNSICYANADKQWAKHGAGEPPCQYAIMKAQNCYAPIAII